MPKTTSTERMAKMMARRRIEKKELLAAFQKYARRIPVLVRGKIIGFDLTLVCPNDVDPADVRDELAALAEAAGRTYEDVLEEVFDEERQEIKRRERMVAQAAQRQRGLDRAAELHAKADLLDAEANELLGGK